MNPAILAAVLGVIVAGNCVQGHGRPGGGDWGGSSGGSNLCITTLAPTSAESTQLSTAKTKCIAEQTGLQSTIDNIRLVGSLWRHGGRPGTGGRGHDDAALLEAFGYTTQATTLRTCIAREMGLVAATDGTFDMVAFKARISAKILGTTVATNTQLGLDSCPAVVAFEVSTYMLCLSVYCQTGAAPVK